MELKLTKILKFFLIYILPFLLNLMYFYYNKIPENDKLSNEFLVQESSVWCKQSQINFKMCKFKDICYYPNLMSFLFVLGNLSVIKGLSNYKEFQTIQLSSVNLHNKFEANVSVVGIDYKVKDFNYIKKGLLFSRFKPDNIMHIIHDDLIPLFLTLENICLGNMTLCEQNYRLVIHDSYSEGSFFDFYKIFSSFKPILLGQLSGNSKALCFGELHMGLVQDSIFYQYGFNKPQGPVENTKLSSNDLLRFVSYIKNRLNIENEYNKNYVVLVSRKKNRRILNESDMINMLETVFRDYYDSNKIEVICLDLFQNKTYAFIKTLSQAYAFVGMHGAEMILSIFLKSNATVVELFPYGIKPNVVSFLKPVANIKGMYFNYIHWENLNINNAVFHPDADPLHGGINYLPIDIQKKITRIKEVPAVYCCNEPTYLYYMYQDTWIESNFESFLLRKLRETHKNNNRGDNEWFYPSPVTNVKCSYNSAHNFINISWTAPFNVGQYEVLYDIYLLTEERSMEKNILVEDTSYAVHLSGNEPQFKIQVWISAVLKTTKTKSKDVFTQCTN